MNSGKDKGIVNAGYRALDSLSIEKGYRHWHADVRLDTTPHEAGLAFTCKLKENTPFVGRPIVERQAANGVTKRIACFTIDE
jgi:sarcosine dehydrogenase